jgi:GGDEF domain-containing protein
MPSDLHAEQHDGERALVLREVARLVDEQVRRTDLLGWLTAETLLVLAPGLDAVAGRSLAMRLNDLLVNRHMEISGMPFELRVKVGSACRTAASPSGWTASSLGAEAALHASEALAAATVA